MAQESRAADRVPVEAAVGACDGGALVYALNEQGSAFMQHAETAASAEPAIPTTLNAFLASVERRAFRLAQVGLGNREDALDAVQDAMLRLSQRYAERPCEEWTPLFWSILRRRIVDLQRRRKVRGIMLNWLDHAPPGGTDDEAPAFQPADQGPGPDQRLIDGEAFARLSAAVRQLPARQQQAFMLRTLEGLDVATTAQAMGCSQGSVKTHLSRALHTLRDRLEDWR